MNVDGKESDLIGAAVPLVSFETDCAHHYPRYRFVLGRIAGSCLGKLLFVA